MMINCRRTYRYRRRASELATDGRDRPDVRPGRFDRLVVSDHVVFGERLEEYARPEIGGARGGVQPTGPDGHWLEPLTTLTYVAAPTSRIRSARTSSLPPSAGRCPGQAGVDPRRPVRRPSRPGRRRRLAAEEYEAAGLRSTAGAGCSTRASRSARRCGGSNARLRRPRAAIRGDPHDAEAGAARRRPAVDQRHGQPTVARRLARFGSGWVPWGDAAADIVIGIAQMRDAVADAAGTPWTSRSSAAYRQFGNHGSIDVDRTVAEVPALVDAGVTDLRAGCRCPTTRRRPRSWRPRSSPRSGRWSGTATDDGGWPSSPAGVDGIGGFRHRPGAGRAGAT